MPSSATRSKKNPNSRYPLYKLTFNSDITLQHLKRIPALFQTKVYWEKYNNSKRYIQYFRCQAYDHTSSSCTKEFRFVKCADLHDSRLCKKSPNVPAKCANCGGDHTANYSKCPSLLKYLDKRTKSSNPSSYKPTTPPSPPSIPIQKPIATPRTFISTSLPKFYAKTDSNISHPVPQSVNNNQIPPVSISKPKPTFKPSHNPDFSTFEKLSNYSRRLEEPCDIDFMLQTYEQLFAKLENCKSNSEKFMALISITRQLNAR